MRLARRSVEAMERLAERSGRGVFLRRGLLWRDGEQPLSMVQAALTAEDVEHEVVAPGDVDRFFDGLRPDGRGAVWQRDAGPVLAAASMAAQADLFAAAAGELLIGREIAAIQTRPAGVRVHLDDATVLDADVVVLAAGPGAQPLLAGLGVDLRLRPVLEQVVHVGGPEDAGRACLFDGPTDEQPGMYAMPTPGLGYKLGIDAPLRDLHPGDLDRTPDASLTELALTRVRRDLLSMRPELVDAQVCSWTESPDGRFVVDSLPGGVVVACGDSGEGFKFSALMGLVLADLAEGLPADADIATFGLARFASAAPAVQPHVLGH